MTASELCRMLGGKRTGRGKFIAKCSAHSDKSPSLAIRDGDKCVLIKCWSGCSTEAVLAAIGLTYNDLFYDSGRPDPYALREAARLRAIEEKKRKEARQRIREEIDMAWKWNAVKEALGIQLAKTPADDKLASLYHHACDKSRMVTPSANEVNPLLTDVFDKLDPLEGVTSAIVGKQVMRYLERL